jgi:hypothetical protein
MGFRRRGLRELVGIFMGDSLAGGVVGKKVYVNQ